ncbi:MAG: nitronate monooxygenase [Dongiaceae bacterium]
MWPDRRLIDLLQIEHPIILSPMAGFSTPQLVAAVCAAGGLGSISCATLPPDTVATTIQALRSLTTKPININFFCHVQAKADAAREQAWHVRLSPYYREFGVDPKLSPPRIDLPPFGDAMCKIVEEAKPEVVSFQFGLPDPALIARIKAAGCRVMSSATTVEEAIWLEKHGADIIIAQGYEAGGHRAMFLAADLNAALTAQPGTLALVPQIADAVRVPVIAAGGIADGRGIAAAFALGAAGAQVGTAYLLCPEAGTPPLHRNALQKAGSDAAGWDATVLTNVFTGRPARALANRQARELGPIAEGLPDFPLPMGELAPLRAKAEQQGSSDFTPLWSGQALPRENAMPAEVLTRKLAAEAGECFRHLNGGSN